MKKSKKLVAILDFDGVLFNTAKFTGSMEEFFTRYGVTKKMFWKPLTKPPYRYSLRGHIRVLDKLYPELNLIKNRKKVLYDFRETLLYKSADYLLEGAIDLIKWMKKEGWTIFIVSHGWKFQSAKIYWSGVIYKKGFLGLYEWRESIFDNLFQSIVVTPEKTKITPIRNIVFNYNLRAKENTYVFVDDTAGVIDVVRENIPEVLAMQFLLPGCPGGMSEYAKKAQRILFSFDELKDELVLAQCL